MKRKWAYLGALFPLTTAAAAWAAGAGGDHEDPVGKFARSKNAQDSEHEKLPDKPDDPQADGAPGVRTPSAGSNGDEAALRDQLDDNSEQLGDSTANVKIAPPPGYDGMYASSNSGGSDFAPSGGGGGVPASASRVAAGPEAPEDTTEQPPAGETPTPVPLADEDAMLILLGGSATGEGDSAATTGDVIFDVVDYGPYTVGYGYAVFEASGSEAEAESFASVYGADLVFTYTDENSDSDSAYSRTYVLAIDFEDSLDAEQQEGLSNLYWMQLMADGPFEVFLGGEEDVPVSTTGNYSDLQFTADVQDDSTPDVIKFNSLAFDDEGSAALLWLQSEQAMLSMNAEAQGVDTLVTAEGSLLEIEDHFSSVNGAVTIIA
jgi:hypothetical protein